MIDWSLYWSWAWRVLVLGALGIGLLAFLDHLGVLAAIGPDASGVLGLVLGAVALFGAVVWVELSDGT